MGWNSTATETGSRFFVPPGDYWLVVTGAVDKYSDKGNPMIELDLEVVGQGCKVRDNLMDPAAMPKAKWKSDTFALSAGLAAAKDAPYSIDTTKLAGLRVYAELVIEERVWQGKTYKSSKVVRYVPKSEQPGNAPAVPPPAAAEPETPLPADSEIPF